MHVYVFTIFSANSHILGLIWIRLQNLKGQMVLQVDNF